MKIKRTLELDSQSLHELYNLQAIDVLIVESFVAKDAAETLADRILDDANVQPYTHEIADQQLYFGVDRLGVPFNSTYGYERQHPTVKRYYQNVAEGVKRLRSFTEHGYTPIDKLKLQLDELTIAGAQLARFENRPMFAGIARITRAKLSKLSEQEPHFDALPTQFHSFAKQFAANIYLKVPNHGGELEVWNHEDLSPLQSCPLRKELGISHLIAPQVGDLVIFNCRKPHAIRSFYGEDRVSLQVFMGIDADGSVKLWN